LGELSDNLGQERGKKKAGGPHKRGPPAGKFNEVV